MDTFSLQRGHNCTVTSQFKRTVAASKLVSRQSRARTNWTLTRRAERGSQSAWRKTNKVGAVSTLGCYSPPHLRSLTAGSVCGPQTNCLYTRATGTEAMVAAFSLNKLVPVIDIPLTTQLTFLLAIFSRVEVGRQLLTKSSYGEMQAVQDAG